MALMSDRKQQVVDLLKSLETKASRPLAFVNPNEYIQHNLKSGPDRRVSLPSSRVSRRTPP
jgi:hypothetical protein